MMKLANLIDTFNRVIGRCAAWLIFAAVVVSAGNALMRKAFSISSNAWLELQWYLYGGAFLLAAAWTLGRNEHVRIDVLSQKLSEQARTWIDLVGHLFVLLPFSLTILFLSWPWMLRSFKSGEHSANAGGLILWPAKALVLVGFALLALQALSETLKCIQRLRQAARPEGRT